MKKPLQHCILDLLGAGPLNFNELAEKLSPQFKNRRSITASLQAMKHDGKVRVCGKYQEGKIGAIAIWEIAPQVSNALIEAWPMPVQIPLGKVSAKHEVGV